MAALFNTGIFFLALGLFLNSNCRFLLVEHLLDKFYALIIQKALDSYFQSLS